MDQSDTVSNLWLKHQKLMNKLLTPVSPVVS